jgi:hypothetical protein
LLRRDALEAVVMESPSIKKMGAIISREIIPTT